MSWHSRSVFCLTFKTPVCLEANIQNQNRTLQTPRLAGKNSVVIILALFPSLWVDEFTYKKCCPLP